METTTTSTTAVATVKPKYTRPMLIRYRNRLKGWMSKRIVALSQTHKQLQAALARMSKSMIDYMAWGQPALVAAYRDYAWSELARFELMIKLDEEQLIVLRTRLGEVQEKLSMPVDQSSATLTAKFFLEPEQLYQLFPDIASKKDMIDAVTPLIRQRQTAYMSLKQTATKENAPRPREQRLQRLLAAANGDARLPVWHYYDAEAQSQFRSLVLDDRAVQGRQVAQLLHELQRAREDATVAPIDSSDVGGFLAQFSEAMAKQYGVSPESGGGSGGQFDRLCLFVSRTIYPVITEHCYELLDQRKNAADDARFLRRQKQLRKKTLSELGVASFLLGLGAADGDAFSEAIAALEEFPLHAVPADMLRCIQQSVGCLFDAVQAHVGRTMSEGGARRGGGAPTCGADEMFPLFLYTVIHADLVGVNEHLSYIDAYATQTEMAGELGYCLTTLMAAVAHVTGDDDEPQQQQQQQQQQPAMPSPPSGGSFGAGRSYSPVHHHHHQQQQQQQQQRPRSSELAYADLRVSAAPATGSYGGGGSVQFGQPQHPLRATDSGEYRPSRQPPPLDAMRKTANAHELAALNPQPTSSVRVRSAGAMSSSGGGGGGGGIPGGSMDERYGSLTLSPSEMASAQNAPPFGGQQHPAMVGAYPSIPANVAQPAAYAASSAATSSSSSSRSASGRRKPRPPARFSDIDLSDARLMYRPSQTRLSAEQLLNGQPPNTFIIRNSSQKNSYALSFVEKDCSVHHVLIRFRANEGFTLEGDKETFPSISLLLYSYNFVDTKF